MAIITPVEVINTQSRGRGITNTWSGLTEADSGLQVQRSEFVDRSIQVTGTFGGCTVLIQGSNDGVNFYTLRDLQGNALSFLAAGLKGVTEATMFIRPLISGGSSVSVDVTMFGKHV